MLSTLFVVRIVGMDATVQSFDPELSGANYHERLFPDETPLAVVLAFVQEMLAASSSAASVDFVLKCDFGG